MTTISELVSRIDGAFSAVKEKAKREQQQILQDHLKRERRLAQYEKVQAQVVEVAKPRLEALARRAGERAAVTPSVARTRRSVKFEFTSHKAAMTLTFSVAPDMDVKNVVVEYDLRIVPVLWNFDTHAEFSFPIEAFDADKLAKWLDDRLVGFVELYIQIHEGELYENVEFVEDPVARVKFPKFAAGATLEHAGTTYFFIDEQSQKQYASEKGIAIS